MSVRREGYGAIGLVAWAAVVIKLVFAATSLGSNDVETFQYFGSFIRAHGLGEMYRSDAQFNHLPLTSLYCMTIAPLLAFPFWLRLPAILADFVTIRALLRRRSTSSKPPSWALLLLAISPVSIFVSGFHGNVDSVMTMAMVLSLLAVEDDRPLPSAAWMALAANVKVASLLLAPLLVLIWLSRHQARRFMPAFVGLTALGWLPGLIAAPSAFVANVLGYSSLWGSWGVTYLSRGALSGGSGVPGDGDDLGAAASATEAVLKLIIIAGALVIAWRARRARDTDVWRAAALTWGVFFVFAPGVGPQYLIWLAPIVLMASATSYLLLTSASLVSLTAFYGVTSEWRFYYAHSTVAVVERWLPWMLLTWVAIGVSTVHLIWQGRRSVRLEEMPGCAQ